MATKKIQTVTVPDPKPGESFKGYSTRLVALQPKRSYGPATDFSQVTGDYVQWQVAVTSKLEKYFPAEFSQWQEENRAYDTAYAAGRQAAAPTTTTPPTTRPPSTSTPPTTTRPPTGTMPPTTAPPTGTMPPTTAPPTTRPTSTTTPPTTAPPTTGTTVPTFDDIQNSTPPVGGTTTEVKDAPPYLPPPRYAKDSNGQWYVYEGAGLVTADGKISDLYYDINNDPGIFYASMTPAERLEVLGKLNDSGFYTAGNIGNYASDLNAISAWLEYSNNAGLSRELALDQIVSTGATMPKTRTGGPPRTYKTSNTDDLKVMAKKISQDTLGRMMSDEELSRFVASYQQSEIDYQKSMYAGRTTEDMQQPDIAAQQFSQELAPTEANAYKYLGYVDQFFNSIGGL
jgi:hypothetical protein